MFVFNGKKNSCFLKKGKKKKEKIPCLSYYNNVTAHEIVNFTEAVLSHMHETSMPSAVRIFLGNEDKASVCTGARELGL